MISLLDSLVTPASFETPSTVCGSSPHNDNEQLLPDEATVINNQESDKETKRDPSNTTLDNFLAQHTSEDNESFEQIMEQARLRQQEKYSFLYKKEEEQLQNSEHRLALPEGKEGDQLMLEDRPAMVDTWKYKNKNALMYCPDGLEHSVKEKIENQTYKPQEVSHANTRYIKKPFPDDSCSGSLTSAAESNKANKQGKIGVDGHEQNPAESPNVSGFGFVAATPSMVPGKSFIYLFVKNITVRLTIP